MIEYVKNRFYDLIEDGLSVEILLNMLRNFFKFVFENLNVMKKRDLKVYFFLSVCIIIIDIIYKI